MFYSLTLNLQHRGFETCSIMLSGKMEHRDSVGNHGVIGPGGVQWMTAGRGIIHSEMPVVTEGDLHGFQLWINLPAKDKMTKPKYQDLQADDIPVSEFQGGSTRVMAGKYSSVDGPLKLRNPGLLLDVRLKANCPPWSHQIVSEWNAFAYVYQGSGKLGEKNASMQHAYIFSNAGDTVTAEAGPEGLRFLLIAGLPINEPIVQYGTALALILFKSNALVHMLTIVSDAIGPFVMNSELEIQQAFHDYHAGKLQNPNDNPWIDEEL